MATQPSRGSRWRIPWVDKLIQRFGGGYKRKKQNRAIDPMVVG